MQTDEYTISLSRELAVCEGSIRKLRRALAELEKRHGSSTEEFLAGIRSGAIASQMEESRLWIDLAASLEVWTGRKEEYEALILKMKR